MSRVRTCLQMAMMKGNNTDISRGACCQPNTIRRHASEMLILILEAAKAHTAGQASADAPGPKHVPC